VRAHHESGSIVIEVVDDGAGFSRERILASARGRGRVDAERLSDDEVYRLVLEPGFSTAERVTDLSGRGVGLDVVRREIEAQRGALSIRSREGAGATLALRLPLTLSLIDGFYVGVADQVYVLQLGAVRECVELPLDAARRPCGVAQVRGEALPYVRLRERFGLDGAAARRESLVVVAEDGRRVGLVVDALLGEGQTVVRPLGPLFKQVSAVAGSTLTDEGKVALILDVPAMLRDVVSRAAAAERA
jgi:two-component system chemotaxis sensor kinase CheA